MFLIVKYLISLTKRNSFNLVLPPSIPYFYQLRCCRFFGFWMHQPDAWISQTTCCFGILLWNFFPVFHYKLRGVFNKSWSWTLLQWALFIFSPEWEIYIFGHSDPFSLVFFAMDIPPGLSFGCLTIQASIFYHLRRLC